MTNIFTTTAPIEAFQTATAFVAMLLSGWMVVSTMQDAAAQIAASDRRHSRMLLALSAQISEIVRFLVILIFFIAGAASLVLPPPHPEMARLPAELLQPIIIRMGMVTATVLLLVDGVVARRTRRQYGREAAKDESESAQRHAELKSMMTEVAEASKHAAVASEHAEVAANQMNTKMKDLRSDLLSESKERKAGDIGPTQTLQSLAEDTKTAVDETKSGVDRLEEAAGTKQSD